MKTALLIVDIQNDYFPGGKGELEGPLEAGAKARQLLQCFREHKQPTVHIQHLSIRPGATTFLAGTEGANIHDSIAHFEGEPLVQKHFPNSFRETNLLDLLKNWEVERVIVCGMMTHMCVEATSRAAADFGFQLIVASDACATRALTFGGTTIPAEYVHKAFLAGLKSYGQVLTVEEIITHLAMEMAKS
jgi:nicotinamidase-related amidase